MSGYNNLAVHSCSKCSIQSYIHKHKHIPQNLSRCQQRASSSSTWTDKSHIIWFNFYPTPPINTIPNKSLGSCCYSSLLDRGQRPKFWCRIEVYNSGTQLPPKQWWWSKILFWDRTQNLHTHQSTLPLHQNKQKKKPKQITQLRKGRSSEYT